MSKGKGSQRKHSKPTKNPVANASTQTTPMTVRRSPSASAEQSAPANPSMQAQAQAPAPKTCLPTFATPEQARACFALERIQALANEWRDDLKTQKEFNSHASAMPFMIRANGLGQAAAFYRRKGTEHVYYRLYALLGDWLSQPERPFADKSDLLEAITHSGQDAYLAAQIEALLFLDWVKKLASAFLAREDDPASAKTDEAAP